jgi:Zn-dependent peptidase ImmA (M78 family)
MSKGDIALVRPEMLRWAREMAGMSLEVAAKKLRVPVARLLSWEKGNSAPTVRQAHILALTYKQPFATFYLPRPPAKKYPKVKDYRKLPRANQGQISSALILEIHRASERREIALELFEVKQENPPVFHLRAELTSDPETLGSAIREKLGLEFSEQASWRKPDIAFSKWRDLIEGLGVLIFQTSSKSLAVKEVRGFSISEPSLPVIVVNRKDAPQAKIFTMLHELTHIIIKNSGLCDPVTLYQRTKQSADAIEIFCNRVAAEALIPKQYFLKEDLVLRIKQGENWTDRDVINAAKTYNTSYEAILRRLLTFKLISSDLYTQKREEYRRKNAEKPKRKGGPVHPVVQAINTNGRPFTNLVIDSYYSRYITSHDLANYLDVKVSQLKQVAEKIGVS